jgi:hypothetical protein
MAARLGVCNRRARRRFTARTKRPRPRLCILREEPVTACLSNIVSAPLRTGLSGRNAVRKPSQGTNDEIVNLDVAAFRRPRAA